MDEFVCLRMIQMNGVDLVQFQFDYDMSFAVIFMNPDGTIYGRYGTRNSKPEGAENNISIEGMRSALEATLALHKGYPANAELFAAKKGGSPSYPTAEQYPKMKDYTPKINYGNQVAKSCIHCHQIHDAERQMLRDAGKLIPDEILHLYPMPQWVGIELDPKKRASVSKVEPNSPAAAAGVKPGDEILFAGGQPLVSVADFQWVLNATPASGATIPLKARRAGKAEALVLSLVDGWRKKADFTWRVSTWDLRRIALGGMILLPDESGNATPTGIYVKNAGKYGNHAVARKAGARPDDKIVEIAGISGATTEAEVISKILDATKKGEPVTVKVKRGGKLIEYSYKTQ